MPYAPCTMPYARLPAENIVHKNQMRKADYFCRLSGPRSMPLGLFRRFFLLIARERQGFDDL
jgi:hypothetical protein